VKSSKAFAFVVLAIAALPLALASGCNTMTSSRNLYPGVPGSPFPPTDPAAVQLLRTEPTKPHLRIGEIFLDPTGAPDLATIEQRFREETAKVGGDASVLVLDSTRSMGSVYSGPWWARDEDTVYGKVIVAVAIRWKER
jgi:hypothetical protein